MSVRWIFDVGANDGDDSDFYLRKGFSVVAVEAHPGLCDALTRRFSSEIAEGRFVLEQYAVGPEEGETKFYVSPGGGHWNTLFPHTRRAEFEKLTVPSTTFSSIMQRNAAPYYVKIDIEGGEKYVIEALGPETAPPYLSFEVGSDGDELAAHLFRIGYREVQLIEQRHKGEWMRPPDPPREGAFVDVDEFTWHRSGLFGRELPSNWRAIDSEDRMVDLVKSLDWTDGKWYDLHLRLHNA